MKKTMLALMMVLGLIAATPAARAEIDLPLCYPCDGK